MNSRRAAALLIGIGWLGAPGAAPANPAGSLPPTVVIPAPGEPADGLAVRPDRGGADDPSAVASAEAPGPDEASPAVPAREAAGAELPGPSGVSQEAAAIEPPEPGPAPDPLRDLPPADLPEAGAIFRPSDPVSRALLERLQGEGLLHPRLARKEREAMLAFYALGDFKPVWISEGAWTPAAQAVRDRLRKADEDALDPAAYAVPDLAAPPRDDVAGADLRLSVAAVLYARDARGARI
jgi:hypothetical protein